MQLLLWKWGYTRAVRKGRKKEREKEARVLEGRRKRKPKTAPNPPSEVGPSQENSKFGWWSHSFPSRKPKTPQGREKRTATRRPTHGGGQRSQWVSCGRRWLEKHIQPASRHASDAWIQVSLFLTQRTTRDPMPCNLNANDPDHIQPDRS